MQNRFLSRQACHLLIAALGGSIAAQAFADDETDRAEWKTQLLAPLDREAARHFEAGVAAPPAGFRKALLARIQALALQDFLNPDVLQSLNDSTRNLHAEVQTGEPGWSGWPTAANAGRDGESGVTYFWERRPPALPDWAESALQERLRRLSLELRNVPTTLKPVPPPRQWFGQDARYTPQGELQQQRPGGQAMVWAGPVVKDGVTRYAHEAENTRLRIDGSAYSLRDLVDWARARYPLDLVLEPGPYVSPTLPLRLKSEIPVWLLNPRGLQAATLTAMRAGHSCDNGMLELTWTGKEEFPVWAILFLPDPALGKVASIRREEAKISNDADYGVAAASNLIVSWPPGTLPPLRVQARRYDWGLTSTPSDTPQVAGTVWSSRVSLANAPLRQEWPRYLSAAGSPECTPQ